MSFQFPSDLGTAPKITFNAYAYSMPKPTLKLGEKKRIGATTPFNATLYAPSTMRDVIGAVWGPETVLNSAYNPLQGEKQGDAFAGGVITDFIGMLGTTITSKGGNFEQVGLSTFKAGMGTAMPPNKLNIFQNMDFITFNATFEMVPKNISEAKSIEQIVKGFKQKIRPTYIKGSSVSLTFPDIFEIKVLSKGKTLFSYQDMALTRVEVGYGGEDGTILRYGDGYPVRTSMALSFTSIEMAEAREGRDTFSR